MLAEWGLVSDEVARQRPHGCDMRLPRGAATGSGDRQRVNASVRLGRAAAATIREGVRMESGRRNRAGAAVGMAILLALAQSSPGNTEAPGVSLAPPPCPRAKAQKSRSTKRV
jgi:hypothetical protein